MLHTRMYNPASLLSMRYYCIVLFPVNMCVCSCCLSLVPHFGFAHLRSEHYTTPCKPDKISCLVRSFLQAAYMHMLIRASIKDIKGIAIRAVQYGLDCVRKCNAEHSTSTSGRDLSCTPGNRTALAAWSSFKRGRGALYSIMSGI